MDRPGYLRRATAGVASWFAFGRNMHLIVASAFAANVVGTANFQYLPMYIRRLGGSIENLGFFFSLQTLILAVFVLIGGWLVDRFNRKLLFSLTPAMAGVACLMQALAPTWQWLIPGMVLSLLSMSIGGPIFFSMTSDIAPKERRAAFFGYQAMAFSVCGIIGPIVGGFFFQYLDYRWFLALGAGLGFAASYLRSLLRDPRDDPNFVPEGAEEVAGAGTGGRVEAGPAATEGRVEAGSGGPVDAGSRASPRIGLVADFVANFRTFARWAIRTPGVLVFMLLINLPAFGGKLTESYFWVYVNEVGLIAPAAIGVLATIAGAFAIPANLFGSRIGDRLERRVVVSAAYLSMGIWIMVATLVSGFPAFATLFIFDGLVHGGLYPSIDAWKADLCPSRHRGTFNGMLQLVGIVIAIPAPLIGARLWHSLGPATPIRLAALIAVVAAILLWRLGPRTKRAEGL